jgi:YHS domain-containing protein
MRSLLRVVAVSWLLFAGPALAGTINDVDGVTIKGYDPVAYFAENRAVPGNAAFTAQYEGATFRFASAEHRDLFLAAPEKYVPQYGGFCAYGTSQGYKAVIDPQAFSIVDGKLYLNYDQSVRANWVKDIPGYVSQADKRWPSVSQSVEVFR